MLDRHPNLRLAGPASEVRHIPNLNQRAPAALQIEFVLRKALADKLERDGIS